MFNVGRPFLKKQFYHLAIVLSLLINTEVFSQVIRGPYLQSGTSTSMVIRWRTDVATNSQVRYGPTPSQLINIENDLSSTNEHEIKLTRLTPLTKYYYSIGSSTTMLQGDTANYFYTLPPTGATGLVRIGVLGDCGNNSTNQLQVRDQLRNYLGSNYMNSWILLGDNAYGSGTDAEYQANFFNYYKDDFLKQSPLYPSPGNHEYANDGNLQDNHNISYYSVFSMPISGEGGGVPSNNKAYYSFNVGNIHFLSLDSYGREDNATRLYDTLGKQVQWIKQDLAANTNKGWVVAYWHHPPYTMGNHNADWEGELVNIRSNFIGILERMGVDLVLCGHSHDYERSKLLSGHYGPNNTFNPVTHNVSNSTGLYNGAVNSCPYIKNGVTQHQGTVYVVSGSAGQLGGQQPGFPHNAMYYSNASNGGSMLLEVEGNRLDAKWICGDGVIRDQFTMMKNVNRHTDTTITAGNSLTLTASYIGNYTWQPGNQATRSIAVTPALGITNYIVRDSYNCIADTFTVNTISILPLTWATLKGWYSNRETVQLQWQTLREKDTRYFEIERSVDGLHFSSIGKTAATGNSNGITNYAFADKTVVANNPIYYYRVKQVDITGSFSYSPVIAVMPNTPIAGIEVRVVPNPARTSEMKIGLLGANRLAATLKLTDALGRTVVTRPITLTTALQSFMPDVPPGTYFLSISTQSAIVTKQVVVQ